MDWEEHLKILNEFTIEELDDQIKTLQEELNKKSIESMNNIHYILKLSLTDKEIIEKIEKIDSGYNSLNNIKPWRLKYMKEQYIKDPLLYKENRKRITEFSEKLKKDII